MQRKKSMLIKIVGFIIVALLFFYYQNNAISVTELNVASKHLPESFDGYRILHISDLHNKWFGVSQKKLIEKIQETNHDMIVITGDIVDANRFDAEPVYSLIKQLVTFAPVYYVTGNHESEINEFHKIETFMIEQGVHVLRNDFEYLTKEESQIVIAGIDDPTMHMGTGFESTLLRLAPDDETYTILLSHRPEKMPFYRALNYDLVFSGHAHGGQFRIPFIGGLIAPNQGFFPKYFEGVYIEGDTSMLVSRGLGNSLFPLRLFNRPELLLVTLKLAD